MGRSSGAGRCLAALAALHAAAAAAQVEPPATWDPRPATTAPPAAVPIPSVPSVASPEATQSRGTSTSPTPAPTAPPTPLVPSVASPEATQSRGIDGDAPPPPEPASPRTGDYRWNLMFDFGPAAAGAPNGAFGFGVALGTLGGVRVETNALLGFASSSTSVAPRPEWNVGGHTYSGAEWTARSLLLELAASRRQGPVELWLGAGLHVSWTQWEATYTHLQCVDLFCTRTALASDTESGEGPGATGLLLGAGVRLAVLDRVLFGLSARWLAPRTSTLGSTFHEGAGVGGLTVGVGLALRLGGGVPR